MKKFPNIKIFLPVVWLILGAVWSPASFAGKTMSIGRITVKNNLRIETSTILSKISLKKGHPFDPEAIRNDIKTLHKTNFFKRVVVETEPLEGELELIYTVYEKPYIKTISFSGNDEFDEEKLLEKIKVKPYTFLNLTEIYDTDVKALKKFYAEDGYYLAEIEPVVEKVDENWVNLTFKITENSEVEINEIIFEGNRKIEAGDIKDAMKTSEYWFLSWIWGDGYLNKEELEADMEAILGLYYKNGFLEAEAGTPKITILEENTEMNIRIKIHEGPQYKVGKISIKGNRIFESPKLMEKVSLAEGDIFNREKVRESVQEISDEYANRGYLLTEVYPETAPHKKTGQADLTFIISEGQIVYANKINITGNTKTIDKVIRREIRIKEGEIITKKKVTRSYQRLANLSFFDQIDVNTKPTDDPSKLDLSINVHDKLTGSFNVGAGFSTLDRMIFNVSMSEGNLFGWGKTAKAAFSIGAVNSSYNFSYRDPYFLDTLLSGGFRIYYTISTDTTWRSYQIERKGISFPFGYQLAEYLTLFETYKIEELYTFSDDDDDTSESVKDLLGKQLTSSSNTTLVRDTRDNRILPTEGHRLSVSIEFAGGALGGYNNYIKSVDSFSFHQELFWKLVFSSNTKFGLVSSFGGQEVPLAERFFLGGAKTVRGYQIGEIGPKEGEDILGGNKMVLFNEELRIPIQHPIYLVLFYDAGMAYSSKEEIDLSQVRQGTGVGVRFLTPMAPIRLDWGYKIGRKRGESKFEWHFSMGSYF